MAHPDHEDAPQDADSEQVDSEPVDADEGEPDIEPFAPDDDPPKDRTEGQHGYGYE